MKPIVCICVPCYNNEKTIADTLSSLVAQTYEHVLIKVFDNASTDASRDIVQSFIDKGHAISLFTRDKTVSGEENFNTCIENAEGDYSAIFHSDDVYHQTMIAEQVAFLLSHETCKAVAVHAKLIDLDGCVYGERFLPKALVKHQTQDDYLVLDHDRFISLVYQYGNFITSPSVMFRSGFLKNTIKAFNGTQFKTSADLDVWFRVVASGCLGFINKPLMSYRLSPASYSYNLARVRTQDHDLFLVLNDYLGRLEEGPRKKTLTEYRDFLLMKDRANTNINRFIAGLGDYQPFLMQPMLSRFYKDAFFFKYSVITLLSFMLCLLPYRFAPLRALVQKIRFG